MHVSSAKDKTSTLTDEPLQGILASKIAELENACTGTFKAEDDDSKSGVLNTLHHAVYLV